MASEEPHQPFDLLHPIYLDTNMSMAFAAALTGGVALEREEVERDDQASETARNLRGSLKLFDLFGIGGDRNAKAAESSGSESRMVRQHTEASLFMTLHDELQRNQQIQDADIASLNPGDMVSLSAGPAVAPLRRVVDQVVRLLDVALPLIGVDEASVPEQTDSADMTRQQRREHARKLAKEAVDSTDDGLDVLRKMQSLFVALQDDLDRSGMVDVVVKRDDEPTVVLTLDKRFVEDQTLELLHTSKFTVVGKVTEIWPAEDELVNLYRRSVMSLVPALGQAAAWGIFTLLGSLASSLDVAELEEAARQSVGVESGHWADADGDESGDDGDSEVVLGQDIDALHPAVTGPAFQILPLAICA